MTSLHCHRTPIPPVSHSRPCNRDKVGVKGAFGKGVRLGDYQIAFTTPQSSHSQSSTLRYTDNIISIQLSGTMVEFSAGQRRDT